VGAPGPRALISVSAALRGNLISRPLGLLGLVRSALYLLTFLGALLHLALRVDISAALGAGIAAPICYIWLGLTLRRQGPQGRADNPRSADQILVEKTLA
jgi:hypothetical protein